MTLSVLLSDDVVGERFRSNEGSKRFSATDTKENISDCLETSMSVLLGVKDTDLLGGGRRVSYRSLSIIALHPP